MRLKLCIEHYRIFDDYLRNRVILATTNKRVDDINEAVSNRLGQSRVYKSIDSIEDRDNEEDDFNYPVEFLNSLSLNGMPPHELKLSVGSVVVLLRNLNKSKGLCNGTRLVITQLLNHAIKAKILTGDVIGEEVFLPRIKLAPANTKLPFVLCRTQFPVKLAFAMTINKSQGQTFSKVGLRLLEEVFAHGQLYVALSRIRRPLIRRSANTGLVLERLKSWINSCRRVDCHFRR
jgi:ATP-dependent DNA helicase PIF1